LNAAHLIGDEPFAVVWGDDVHVGNIPRLRQMIETFDSYGDPVLGVMKTDAEGTKKYGIIDPAAQVEKYVFQLKSVVEKPGPERAPSLFAANAGYIVTPDIFEEIRRLKPGAGGELVLLDAIHRLMKKRPAYARVVEGEYYDTGTKIGWLRANLSMALGRADMRKDVLRLLEEVKRKR
jgi:UTP--glucose-1-phosphate uridylyltransferase